MDNKKITGDDVYWMADLTSTGKILSYWQYDPEISYVVTVLDPDLKLEDVAATVMNDDLNMFSEWVLAGMITFDPPTQIELACMCIRLNPYYIIKLTGGNYGDSEQDIIDDLNDFIKEL